jgi:Tfp pilus assembly protein FimV
MPLIAVAAVVAGVFVGAGQLTATRAGSTHDPTAAGPSHIYVVRPGDSLWSIAESVDPSGDPRPLVVELQSELRSSTLQPGERIRIP